MWLFKEQRLSVPHWRSQRPYLISQKVLIFYLFNFLFHSMLGKGGKEIGKYIVEVMQNDSTSRSLSYMARHVCLVEQLLFL